MFNVVVVFFLFLKLKMAEYDQTIFMALERQTLYYADLPKRKLLRKWGICLDKVPD